LHFEVNQRTDSPSWAVGGGAAMDFMAAGDYAFPSTLGVRPCAY
jgi:hypothetical protein